MFFVDLPGRDQKDGIWSIYVQHYGLDAKQARPDDTNWTGAEIKSCLSADRAGVYSRSEGGSGGRVRRVVREPGVN